jgi:hypothetical protein
MKPPHLRPCRRSEPLTPQFAESLVRGGAQTDFRKVALRISFQSVSRTDPHLSGHNSKVPD